MQASRPPASPEGLTDVSTTVEVLRPYLRARRYHAEQVLWIEGEVSGRLVLLEEGRVKAIRTLPDGSSILLYVFGPGDVFGFLPFVDGGPYPATAIAVDDVMAQVMTRSALRTAIQRDPNVAMALLGALGARLRQAFGRIGDYVQRSAAARVAAALSLLLPSHTSTQGTIIAIPSPIQGFAADISMTAETFSRAVTQLVDAGVLHRLASPQLQILDIERLQAIASGRNDLRSQPVHNDSA